MPDTPRTRDELATLFADNATGDISAQDLRDFLASTPLSTDSPTIYLPLDGGSLTGNLDLNTNSVSLFIRELSSLGDAGTDKEIALYDGSMYVYVTDTWVRVGSPYTGTAF